MNYRKLYGNQKYLRKDLNIDLNIIQAKYYTAPTIVPNENGYSFYQWISYPSPNQPLIIGLDLNLNKIFEITSNISLWSNLDEIICSENGNSDIVVFSNETGNEIKRYKIPFENDYPTLIFKNIYYSDLDFNGLLKKSFDGKTFWKIELPYVKIIASKENDLIVIQDQDKNSFHGRVGLFCISDLDGSIKWNLHESFLFKKTQISDLLHRNIYLHDNGILLVQSRSQGILGVKAETGKILWKWKPDLKKIEPIRQKNLAHQNDPKPNVKKMNLNTFSFTIDYEGIVHILNHEYYTQLNSLTGSIINEFKMDSSLIQERPYFKYGYSYYEKFIGSEVTVSKTHVIGSNCERIIFINKTTGKLEKIISGEDPKHGVIRRILITGENKMITIEDCSSKNLDPYYMKIWKAI